MAGRRSSGQNLHTAKMVSATEGGGSSPGCCSTPESVLLIAGALLNATRDGTTSIEGVNANTTSTDAQLLGMSSRLEPSCRAPGCMPQVAPDGMPSTSVVGGVDRGRVPQTTLSTSESKLVVMTATSQQVSTASARTGQRMLF